MPNESIPSPESAPPEQSTLLGGIAPDEMVARALHSVKMTGGALGIWQPPSIEECAPLFFGYEVLRLLGRGGMGAVYQAREIELDRMVAIKLLPLEISVDKDFADRFRREARAMAKLNHPNVIGVHAFGTTKDGHLYFVMEFVDGANLADVIHQVDLTLEQALSIIEQICNALAYAHSKGVIHRDIKPANVMIDTESHVKVADFGLARLTDPGAEQMGHTMTCAVMGTPDYMAPEQMKGMNVDHRADIYSLGVMVYEMFCREVPRGAFEPPSVRIGCDQRIDPIVHKAMQPNPDRRYQSTQEMRNDVSAVRAEPMESGTPAGAAPSATSSGATRPRPPPPAKPPTPLQPPIPATSAPGPSAAAVMQAIPLPTAKAKSKTTRLALGIAMAVLVIGGFVFLLMPRAKPTTDVTAKPWTVIAALRVEESAQHAQSQHFPKDGEKWADAMPSVFRDSNISRESDGTARVFGAAAQIFPVLAAPLVDQAARMTVRGQSWGLDVRNQHGVAGSEGRGYELRVKRESSALVLDEKTNRKQSSAQLKLFPLPAGFNWSVAHTMELRAVGRLLSVTLDGNRLGDVVLSGKWYNERGYPMFWTGEGAVIERAEYLDLGGTAPADTPVAITPARHD